MVALAAVPAAAQLSTPPPAPLPSPSPEAAPPERFRLWAEVKVDARHSPFVQTAIFTPRAPGDPVTFTPTGFQRTPDAGTALELQNVALVGEGDLGLGVSAKVELHVLDLYNRNPTSSDDRILVRQAWIRFG